MSEIVCPHCGQANALEAQKCSSCQKSLYAEPSQPYRGSTDDEMEWLKNYRSFGGDETTVGNDEDKGLAGTQGPDDTEIPDWLARIRARKGDEVSSEPDEEPRPEGSFTPSSSSPGVTDWLKNIQELEAQQAQRDEEENQEFPDWLARIAQRKAEEAEQNSFDEEPPTPPSLTGESNQERDFFNEPQPIGEKPNDGIEVDLPGEGFVDLPPDLFGILENSSDDISQVEKSETEEEPSVEGNGLRQEFFPVDQTLNADSTLEEPVHDLEQLISFQSPVPGGVQNQELDTEGFDLESTTGEGEFVEDTQGASNPAEQPAQTNQLPDWLFSSDDDQPLVEKSTSAFDIFRESPPSTPGIPRQEFSAYAEDSVPDWLKDSERTSSGSIATEVPNEEPASGMPDWLQSMQPVATRDQKRNIDYEGKIEGAGPLAGYQGILPGSLAATHYSKPPVYSDNLHITDKQRIYATLFDTLIAEETKTEEAAVEKSKVPAQLLRSLVGLLLIAVVIIALIFNTDIGVQPALFPSENVTFYNAIQTLSNPGAPSRVLVGIDYNPSLAGELEVMAVPVIESLLGNSSDLVFISLNTAGPALAEKLISRSSSGLAKAQAADHASNLGYLPGGASALAGFALSPSQSAPLTLDGRMAWENPSLLIIKKAGDFDAVLLLTDNTESARDWIEQVQTTLEGKPFLVLASAQAAPGLQPYWHSGQVNGMLAGLSGRASYLKLDQGTEDALGGYWDAYQIGMLLITALILVGAIVFSIKNLFSGIKKA